MIQRNPDRQYELVVEHMSDLDARLILRARRRREEQREYWQQRQAKRPMCSEKSGCGCHASTTYKRKHYCKTHANMRRRQDEYEKEKKAGERKEEERWQKIKKEQVKDWLIDDGWKPEEAAKTAKAWKPGEASPAPRRRSIRSLYANGQG